MLLYFATGLSWPEYIDALSLRRKALSKGQGMPLPWFFLIAILMIPIGVALLIFGKKHVFQSEGDGKSVRVVSIIILSLGIFCLVLSSLTVVGTRRIGVVTSFGRPTDTLSNGIHLKWPWEKVPELDGSIQTDSHSGGAESDEDPCTDIRIGNESTACVDNTIRWRITEGEGDQLYRDYRGMDNIRDSLVTRELNAALNRVLGDFNPLDAVSEDGASATANLDDLATAVTEVMRERVEGRIDVLSITLPLIRYDRGTQERLNAYQAEIANTRIAEQERQTAHQQALANEELADSVSNDPNVLVSRCLDTFADMVEAGQEIPAGFSCWPGSQSALVVPSTNTGNR